MRREFLRPGPKADLLSLTDFAGMEPDTLEYPPAGNTAASVIGPSAEF